MRDAWCFPPQYPFLFGFCAFLGSQTSHLYMYLLIGFGLFCGFMCSYECGFLFMFGMIITCVPIFQIYKVMLENTPDSVSPYKCIRCSMICCLNVLLCKRFAWLSNTNWNINKISEE